MDDEKAAPNPLDSSRPEASAPATEWPQAREFALKQLDRLVGLEPKVLRGNRPEAVHALRVASRRLQERLDAIYPKPRPSEIRRLRRKVRRCRRVLSGLRNCDALLTRAEARLASPRCTRRKAWETVAAFLHQRRESLFAKAARKLTRMNVPELYLQLRECLTREAAAPGLSRDGAAGSHAAWQVPAGEPLPIRLAAGLAARWEEFERQAEKANQDPEHTGLHPARIAAKRLRYLMEVADEFGMEGTQQPLASLRKLQAALGAWHDFEISEIMLTKMVGDPKFIRENLSQVPQILKIIGQHRRSKERLGQKGLDALRHSARPGPIRTWVNSLQ